MKFEYTYSWVCQPILQISLLKLISNFFKPQAAILPWSRISWTRITILYTGTLTKIDIVVFLTLTDTQSDQPSRLRLYLSQDQSWSYLEEKILRMPEYLRISQKRFTPSYNFPCSRWYPTLLHLKLPFYPVPESPGPELQDLILGLWPRQTL